MKFILLFVLIIVAKIAFSQNNVDSKLVDAITNEPMPFVHITIPNKKIGLISDESGAFLINNLDKSDTIKFSSIGYTEKAILVGDINNKLIKLDKKIYILDEVVIRPENIQKKLFGDLKKKSSSTISNNSRKGGFQILRLLSTNCVGCRISKISFFINNFTEQSKKMRLRIYSYDDKTQEPQEDILNKSIIITRDFKRFLSLENHHNIPILILMN